MKQKLAILIFLLGFLNAAAFGSQPAPPEAPLENPHPPLTAKDKARVAFAEALVKNAFFSESVKNISVKRDEDGVAIMRPLTAKLDLDEACVKDASCLAADLSLNAFVKSLIAKQGRPESFKHPHIIPWSFEKFKNPDVAAKPDEEKTAMIAPPVMPVPEVGESEYLIHVYLQLQGNGWHHLDLIVHEAPDGKMRLKGLFLIPMRDASSYSIPDGAVC